MSVPYPDPVLIAVLADLPVVAESAGGRVGVVLDAILPALRVTKVGDAEPPTTFEGTPIYRVEVWADDELTAGEIAWRIANTWPASIRKDILDARIHGRWVDLNPRPLPDPETAKPRYLIDLGIRISGVTT